jgi:hypothetical protein
VFLPIVIAEPSGRLLKLLAIGVVAVLLTTAKTVPAASLAVAESGQRKGGIWVDLHSIGGDHIRSISWCQRGRDVLLDQSSRYCHNTKP